MVARVLVVAARGCTWVGAAALVVMMLGTDWDVLARQVANSPLTGVVELVEVMVLATAMLGLPEAFLRDEQIRVDLVDGILPPHALRIVRAGGLVLSIAFLSLLAWHVVPPMLDARTFGDVKPDLGVPLWPLYALILFAFAASVLACCAALRTVLRLRP